MSIGTRIIRAPRGSAISCKGWAQEAALRMLMNNLDPDVAERPQDLVVYGGTGKAARSWPAFDVIVKELEQLEDDARLVVAVARTAAAHGARVVSYASVVGLRDDGVDAVDELTGAAFSVRARHTIVAAGV